MFNTRWEHVGGDVIRFGEKSIIFMITRGVNTKMESIFFVRKRKKSFGDAIQICVLRGT
jgi:hypothetical protein